MTLISSLCGKPKPLAEFTGVGAVAPTTGSAVIQNLKPAGSRISRLRRHRKHTQEGAIPDDAEEISLDAEVQGGPGIHPTDTTRSPDEEEEAIGSTNMLSVALALVAPDCTSGWDKPLSPSLLPRVEPKTRPFSATPEPSSSGEPESVPSARGMLKLVKPSNTSGDQTKAMGESLANSVVQSEVSHMSGEALLGQGKPMPEPTSSNSAASTLKKFNFGGR